MEGDPWAEARARQLPLSDEQSEIIVSLHRRFEESVHEKDGVEFLLARELQELFGSGAQRQVDDIALTRYACYLIAQNGDPKKAEIAFAIFHAIPMRFLASVSSTALVVWSGPCELPAPCTERPSTT